MAKFIEVHTGHRDQDNNLIGLPVLINLDSVLEIVDGVQRCSIFMLDSYELKVLDSYEDIRRMVSAGTGGIPMGK